MRKLKLGLFTMAMCMLLGSTTASAASFRFVVVPEGCDGGYWIAVKYNDIQTAYITPTSISGSGRIWAAVYDLRGSVQCTGNVAIQQGHANEELKAHYYNVTAYQNVSYRILGCDDEWEVTSPSFVAEGNWTP